MSDADAEEAGTVTPPRKKTKGTKQMCIYQKKWEEVYKWVRPDQSNKSRAYCTLCIKGFSIAHGGHSDITQHLSTECHKLKCRASQTSNKINSFFVTPNTAVADNVAACELSIVYHTVKHNLSYNSMDCGNKLIKELFCDSELCKKTACGRTKAETLVKSVLAPKSVQDFVDILSSPLKSTQFFSLATDASNKGNRKMFPICVRYFDPSEGVKNKLLSFIEQSDESATSIHDLLKQNLEKHGLNLDFVTSYSADNANVNYGKHHSVYKLLTDSNDKIIKTNCAAHILHNACKYACDRLDLDIETMVLKTYSHFSVSAKRRSELKEFFNFIDLEWSEVLRHVTTRWLSLNPAVERLTKNWEAIKSYFKSIEDCPKFLKQFFSDENPEVELVAEIYLNFYQNIGSVFQLVTKTLELESLSVLESFNAMKTLRQKIEQRKEDMFLGSACQTLLETIDSPAKQTKIKNDFTDFFVNLLKYLDKNYDFSENNIFHKLTPLTLKKELKYCNLQLAVRALKLEEHINLDELYDEFCLSKDAMLSTVQQGDKINVNDKWVIIFKECGTQNMPNFVKLITFVLSMPGSNAHVERIFSLMVNKWSDNRNRCSTSLIEAELQVVINYALSCREFYNYVKKDQKMLRDARSFEKYKQ